MLIFPFLIAASSAGIITVMAAMSMGTVYALFVSLSIIYNWGFLCSPAMPQPLADDLRDFIGYTVQPKCPWFPIGTLSHNYTNEGCYSCEATKAATSSHCVRDWHFYSLFDNIAFTAVAALPGLPQYLTDLGLGAIVNSTAFGNLLTKWETTYKPDDLHNFSALWICNGFWTLWPNIFITSFAIELIIIASPYFAVVALALASLWYVLLAIVWLVYTSLIYLSMMYETAPFLMTYGVMPETILAGPTYAQDASLYATGSTVGVMAAQVAGQLFGAAAPGGRSRGASQSTLQTLWEETKAAIGGSPLGLAVQSLRRRGRTEDDTDVDGEERTRHFLAYQQATAEMHALHSELFGGAQQHGRAAGAAV